MEGQAVSKGRFTGSIEERWDMLDTHILGTMTYDPANGTRLEGDTATLTRDLLMEVLREVMDSFTLFDGAYLWEEDAQEKLFKRIEALPDYSEDEG